MDTGVLVYDIIQKRIDIRFGLEEFYGGLHCGECFQVEINGMWVDTRVEYSHEHDDWYLIGVGKDISLVGLRVRI